MDASNASTTRTQTREGGKETQSKGLKEGRNNGSKDERKIKIFHHFKEIIQASNEGLQLVPQGSRMASLWAKVLEHAGELEKVTREPLEGDTQILLDIQKKVGEIGKQLGGGQASSPHLGGQPTWSNVLKGSHLPARVEVRMEEMSGTEKETSAKRLEKIRKAIPDAKAIIPHPRAQNKVLVIVRDKKRRDQSKQCRI